MQEVFAHWSALALFSIEIDCLHSTQSSLPSYWKIVCREPEMACMRGNGCGLYVLGFLCLTLFVTLHIRYASLF